MLWWTITGHQYFLLSHYWRVICLIRACKTSNIVCLSEETSATLSLYELKIRLSVSVWIDWGLKLNSIPLVEWVLIGHNYLPRFPWFFINCGYICPNVINNSIWILWSTITNLILRLIFLRWLLLHRCLVESVSDHQIIRVGLHSPGYWMIFLEVNLFVQNLSEKLSYILLWRFIFGNTSTHHIIVKFLQMERCFILFLRSHLHRI